MSDFRPAFDYLLPHEGGYCSDPDDPGGETKYGISKRDHPDLDIKKLTVEDARAIYERDYWQPRPFCLIDNQDVANKVFDITVNAGYAAASKILQQSCIQCGHPVLVDGKIGPLTIKAVNDSLPYDMLNALRENSVKFYRNLVAEKPRLQKFLNGWLRRAMA